MTFLPIVARELRVATRKRGTFWLRVVAALVALVIGGGFLLVASVASGGRMPLGGALFATLTWMSLAGALSAGLFFTSDCLSEEKREGTLGFLFLTDLRGYDVVLGKLFVTSLRAAFALLAVLPILAVTLLMGGVEAGQFWKTMLALLNAMVFSLATGMFVSVLSRNGQKALAGTLFLMALWTLGGMAVDGLVAAIQNRARHTVFGLSSPFQVFRAVAGWPAHFWLALLVNQAVAWLQLALACVLVRRNWQESERKVATGMAKRRSWWRAGVEKRRRALRAKWLGRDPMLWLALRERGSPSFVWFWPALFVAGAVVGIYQMRSGRMWGLWSFLSAAVSLAVYLAVASQAAQFFAEARRTRLVELLLAAPLTPHQIVMGPWRALVRQFAGLGVLLIGIQLVGTVLTASMQMSLQAGTGIDNNTTVLGLMALLGAVVTVANLAALGWFGLWMGMTSRNALLATLKTIVFVQIVPWFVITIAAGLLVPLVLLPWFLRAGAGSTSAAWFSSWYLFLSSAVTAGLALGKDLIFWRWSRRKLMKDFREQATRTVAPIHLPPAPPVLATKP